MTATIIACVDAIEVLWEALTPPDRAQILYHRIDTTGDMDGSSGERGFIFDPPVRQNPVAEAGSSLTEVQWSVQWRLRIASQGRDLRTLHNAIANEGNQLCRAVETNDSWPAGVLSVETRDVIPEVTENGDVELVSEIVALCQETD